jgi:hypothetical protein
MNRFLFLAPFLLACSVHNPEAPNESVPLFIFHNATTSEQQAVLATWQSEAACIGLDPAKARLVPFTVIEGKDMYCGKTLAAGCTAMNPPSVTVRREWFSREQCALGYEAKDCHAMSTELLHLALLLHGESWGYENPAFQRCI